MVQWFQVILMAMIALLLLEARISLGTRIAVMEERLAWLTANLRKWGLVAPGNDVDIRVATEADKDKRTPNPPAPRR